MRITKAMNRLSLIVLFFGFLQVLCKLDIVEEPYAQIITHINDYYKCDFILLFGDTMNMSDRPLNRQFIHAKHNMKLKNMEKFQKAEKPLVVFFNNLDSTKFQLMTSAVDASKPIFCFFMNVNTEVEEFFSNIYFPYRYKFIVSQRNKMNSRQEIIWKVKLDNNKKQIAKLLFATWNEVAGIKSFARPEEILSSRTLRVGIRHSPPIVYVKQVNNKLQISGYMEKMAETLESLSNSRFTYTIVDSSTGSKENGTWSGGIGLIMNNSIDILFNPIVITPERKDDVDFSFPLFVANEGMFIKNPDQEFSWSSYYKSFDITVWCVIILTIIIGSIVLTVFEYYKKRDVIKRLKRKPIRITLDYTEILLDAYKAMCGQGLNQSLYVPTRIFQLTIHTTALLILAFYSAVFLSIITTPVFKLPITGVKDLIEDSRYKLGGTKPQAWEIFGPSNDEIMQKIFHKHIKTQNPIPKSLNEGHRRMCKDDKYAFISADIWAYSDSSLNCTLLLIEHLSTVTPAVVFQHNSPYAKIFNKLLLKMHESGILKKIKQENLLSSKKVSIKKIEESITPINGLQVLSILLIFIGFMLFSIILFLLEIFFHRRISRRGVNSC